MADDKRKQKLWNEAHRLCDSIQRGLGNPDLTDYDLEQIKKALEQADKKAWK